MTGFSVIIPTLNRTAFLKQTLDCLVVQDFEYPFEILIVDQSDVTDEKIVEYATAYPLIKYYHITEFRGLPEARNFGWQHAKFDYILYLDDDILCDKDLLKEHYKYITREDIGIVAGGITEKYGKNIDVETGKFDFWRAIPIRGFHIDNNKFIDHCGGGNFSTNKEVLTKIHGIDENLSKGAALYEETDFCLRAKKANYKIFFNYKAHVVHLAAADGGCRVKDINRYVFNLARNRTIIIRRHLKWYYKISAYLYLLKIVLAYSWANRKIGLLKTGIKGVAEGRKIEML